MLAMTPLFLIYFSAVLQWTKFFVHLESFIAHEVHGWSFNLFILQRWPLAKIVLLLVILPQFILVLLVGHAFNLNINVLIAIEIRVFLSFHCPKIEVTTCINCGCKTAPAVFSSIENFDKELCQALDSSELIWLSKRREGYHNVALWHTIKGHLKVGYYNIL